MPTWVINILNILPKLLGMLTLNKSEKLLTPYILPSTERIPLSEEQKELLFTLIDAKEKMKKRNKFRASRSFEKDFLCLSHSGFTNHRFHKIKIYSGDLEALARYGLISNSWRFDLTQVGIEYSQKLRLKPAAILVDLPQSAIHAGRPSYLHSKKRDPKRYLYH